MDIENVLIEHLPRLKCANFFILFNRTLGNILSVRVHLRPTEIYITFDDNRATTVDLTSLSVQIQVDSLSLFIAKNHLISFRINIASSFQEEILPTPANQIHLKQLLLNVQPHEHFYVTCGNCAGPLSELLCYKRILELPSENMDSSDWFCHKHDSDDQQCGDKPQSPVTNFKSMASLASNDDNLLFGNFFALFNSARFTNIQVNARLKQTHCRRCLNHIGVCASNNTFKLWNNNIKIKKPNEMNGPTQRLFSDSESMLCNFLTIINRITYDFQMLGRQTLKLLFEAENPNGTTTFLFIQTMARNLELYQMLGNEVKENDANKSHISMTSIEGIKCLFLCEESTDPAFVNFWQQDMNVLTASISIEMLEFVLDSLRNVSKYVPEQFRSNNGFTLSYISHGIH